MFFLKEYKAKRIKAPDNFANRKRILSCKDKNLIYLLSKRFKWMERYIKGKKVIVELGSGNGCIKKIINNKKIILTDIIRYPWINKKVDMLKVNLGKKYLKNVDIFIINHSLHHCANPGLTLKKLSTYLKKDGYVLINEPETSFFLKFIQIILDDESWSLRSKVFKKKIYLTQKVHGFLTQRWLNYYLKMIKNFKIIFLNMRLLKINYLSSLFF